MQTWVERAVGFLSDVLTPTGASSVPNGAITLYGTCYAWMSLYYLGQEYKSRDVVESLIRVSQIEKNGLFVGPELKGFKAPTGTKHDYQHLLIHLACSAVLPVAQQIGICIKPLYSVYEYCDPQWLTTWQSNIDWRYAWFEGNNILFVGQLLVYLRDVEKHPHAAQALGLWFDWLDRTVDPRTGLWGTNGYCSPMEAVYGGYHQLLVYYYENHPLPNIKGLVDTVLALQHYDGGFNPSGNSGACEDADSVDILVNCYKRLDYRRLEIRNALRRCLKHILSTQNPDGGFPYNRNQKQTHMGIPGTEADSNVSCTFPTWFRIHTLALIAEVLPNELVLRGIPFRFNKVLSMGWHASPPGWKLISDELTFEERMLVVRDKMRQLGYRSKCGVHIIMKFARKLRQKRTND